MSSYATSQQFQRQQFQRQQFLRILADLHHAEFILDYR